MDRFRNFLSAVARGWRAESVVVRTLVRSGVSLAAMLAGAGFVVAWRAF